MNIQNNSETENDIIRLIHIISKLKRQREILKKKIKMLSNVNNDANELLNRCEEYLLIAEKKKNDFYAFRVAIAREKWNIFCNKI